MATPHDPRLESSTEPAHALASPSETTVEVAVSTAKGPGVRVWALTLAIALSAGLGAWTYSEMSRVAEVGSGKRGGGGAPRVLTEVPATQNAIVAYSALGLALGLGLGLAGGLIRFSVLRILLAVLVGVVLGGLAGREVSTYTLPVYYNNVMSGDLVYSLLVHGATWTAIGAAAGLAFGLGRGEWRSLPRYLVGGAVGALIGAIIYEITGIIFPLAMTDRPLPNSPEIRLIAQIFIGGMVAAGAVLSSGKAAAPSPQPQENPA